MTQPIEVKLPNGLIIAMLPNSSKSGVFGVKSGSVGETDEQLWQRFIHALTTTDWNALGKVYSTAMPASKPAPTPTRPVAVPSPAAKEAPTK